MRLFHILPALSLLFGARAFPRVFDSGEAAPHRVEARDVVTNVCFPFKGTATIAGLLPPGFAYYAPSGGISCLCLSSIPSSIFVEVVQYTYQFAAEATNEFMEDFANLLSDGNSGCSYPDYSVPTCGSSTSCGFTCIPGYTLSGSNCVSS